MVDHYLGGDETMNVIDQLVELRNRGIKVVSIEFILRELIHSPPNSSPNEQEHTSSELLKENDISTKFQLKTSVRGV